MLYLLLTSYGISFGQSGKEELEKAEKEASEKRQRGFGGQRTENELKDERGKLPANQKNKIGDGVQRTEQKNPSGQNNSDNKSEVIKSNEDQTSSKNGTMADSSGNQSTTTAVIQRTTSESGSPSVLSSDNGRERDGTNNVQRSTLNIAGSPVRGNLNLDRKNSSQQNRNTATPRILKREEQPGTGHAHSNAGKKASGSNKDIKPSNDGKKNTSQNSSSSKSKARQATRQKKA